MAAKTELKLTSLELCPVFLLLGTQPPARSWTRAGTFRVQRWRRRSLPGQSLHSQQPAERVPLLPHPGPQTPVVWAPEWMLCISVHSPGPGLASLFAVERPSQHLSHGHWKHSRWDYTWVWHLGQLPWKVSLEELRSLPRHHWIILLFYSISFVIVALDDAITPPTTHTLSCWGGLNEMKMCQDSEIRNLPEGWRDSLSPFKYQS